MKKPNDYLKSVGIDPYTLAASSNTLKPQSTSILKDNDGSLRETKSDQECGPVKRVHKKTQLFKRIIRMPDHLIHCWFADESKALMSYRMEKTAKTGL